MLLREFADKHETQPQIQIFATDLDEAAINTARNGFYTEAIEADVSPERLRRFFTEETGGYRIKKAVRETVLFAVHDLLKDPLFSRLDAVTCRNLLIYLNRDAQKHLFGLFHLVLRPNGFMFLGNSESADAAADLFQTVDKKQRIYRHQPAPPPRAQLLPNVPLDLLPPRAFSVRIGRSSESQKISFSKLHRQILEQSAPASVLVNQNYDIVHLTGRTADFLEFAPGEPLYNLLKVVQPELRIELRTALFQAQQSRESVEARRRQIKRDGQEFFVNTLVRPSVDRNSPNRTQNGQIYFAVLFMRIESLTTVAEAGVPETDEAEPVLRLLEAELHRTREAYQMITEQFETQTEELKAANEELQTINEELRSASEELEIGKEELHSVNEETQTVNYELKSKIDELAHSNGDLRNLIASTDMATIFVDSALNIKFYTPRAQNIFNVINSDIGRSLLDITHNLEYTDLRRDAERVLNDFQNLEREVSSRDERWYIARIILYRAAENRIDGAILTFVDFTTRKQVENDLLIAN